MTAKRLNSSKAKSAKTGRSANLSRPYALTVAKIAPCVWSARECGDDFGVHAGRGGQEALACRGPRAASSVGDPSAGLGDEQCPRKQVRAGPRELPEGVDPADGHAQQVQRRGHGCPHHERVEEHRGDRAACAPHDLFVLVRPGLARSHDAQAEGGGFGHAQRSAVPVGFDGLPPASIAICIY